MFRTLKRQGMALVAAALLVISLGCGSSQNPTANTTTNTPTAPTSNSPSPTPSPTPTSAGEYLATVFLASEGSSAAPRGTIVVNAQADNGSGTLQISGGQPSTSYQLQFCLAPGICKPVTTYTTNGSGSATVNFQIPPGTSGTSGHYVGSFSVLQGGNAVYNSGANAQASGVSFSAPLLPGLPETPPGGGSVSVSGQTLHVALSGVPPSLNYEVSLCAFTSAGVRCNSFGTVTVNVDAQGKGAADFNLGANTFIGFVEVKNQFNQRYDSGFRAP